MKTGWYDNNNIFLVVKPLHNGKRQSLIVGAEQLSPNKWNIFMGVFPSNATSLAFTIFILSKSN